MIQNRSKKSFDLEKERWCDNPSLFLCSTSSGGRIMTVKEIAEEILRDSGPISLVILAMLTFIQITPIKLNPWSALFRWLGRQMNGEVIQKIDKVEERLDKHIADSDESDLKARRASILDFSSSVIRGVNYHKEKFDFMIQECDSYEKYCHENNIINGVATASIAEIRRIYQEHLRNDDFLVEKGIK